MWVIILLFFMSFGLSWTQNETTGPQPIALPAGDVRNCPTQGLTGNGLKLMQILPGGGFDNLRNVLLGDVHEYTYNNCRISRDGKFLLPDNVFLLPLEEGHREFYAELFKHWNGYTSINSRSINAGVSFFSKIGGKFSDEYLSVKKHQVSESSQTTRVKLNLKLYTIKIQPGAQLSTAFKANIFDIAAQLQNNRLDFANYLAELMVRDYGTHYITSVDAGGVAYQLDYISSDYLQQVGLDISSVTASAGASFANFGANIGSKQSSFLNVSEQFYTHRRHSEQHIIGGPQLKPGLTLQEWASGVVDNLAVVDRSGNPLHFAITPNTVPELPPVTVRRVAATVYNAINRYYMVNTRYGCTVRGSPNFDFQANVDDGSCNEPTVNFTFGGLYQSCSAASGSYIDICTADGGEQRNPLTGSFSCPQGFREVELNSGTLSHVTEVWTCRQQCRSCGSWWRRRRCCNCVNVQVERSSTAAYSAYWCAPSQSMATNRSTGYLFGGSYTSTSSNPVTDSMNCPNNYTPLRVGADIYVCGSGNVELGLRFSIPFGGFESCRVGNPLAADGAADQSTWPHQCPTGFSRHALGIDGDCEISYCAQTGVLSNLLYSPPKLPPFTPQPSVTGNTTTANSSILLLAGSNGRVWVKSDSAQWERASREAIEQLTIDPQPNSGNGNNHLGLITAISVLAVIALCIGV